MKSRRFDESREKLEGSLWKSAVEVELARWNWSDETGVAGIFPASRKS
jgi:hypothetical protein